jgi:Lar family restriction alleviation protein
MCFAMTGPQSISPGIELLPCPFCGETDVGFGRTGQKWQTVACNECGAEGPCTEIDRDLIVQKWNARALQPATTTAGQVWCEPCGHHVMPEQIAECCAEPCALATGGDAVAGEAKAAEDIIISYFDSHGINDARAGAFNILDRLREAGLTVTAIRSPDEAATPPNPMSFFSENVDAWGPVEWFNRLSKAVREHGDAVRANDETMMEICRNVAISSAWRLVGDYDQQVRAALTPNVAQPAAVDMPKWLRDAFDGDSVPKKNIALRMAYDEIVRLSTPISSTEGKSHG